MQTQGALHFRELLGSKFHFCLLAKLGLAKWMHLPRTLFKTREQLSSNWQEVKLQLKARSNRFEQI